MMIIEKFGIYSKKYLTIKPNLLFGDISVVCCKIIYDSKKEPTYIIFGEKCGLIKQVNLDKLINDILECLKFTEKKSILHNDIKYENIMYCDNRYKLIDWGNASFHNIQRGGLFTGPLKKYMTGHTLEESRNDLHTKLASRFQSLYDSKIFKEVHNRILNEFDIILTKTNDREKLKRDYKGNHDLFSFGLTILHIVVLENLDYNKYSRIIMALTSYISPMTASRAYDYSKDLYGETPYCTGL
jgi:serine/threonine protein kinase